MSFDRKRDRQTHIMDDAAAISMAQQGQRRGKKKTVANLFASENASSSTTRPTTSQITRPRFYEADGLKIPLYEKGGKRKVHARLSSSLRNKNLAQLLITVEAYAGAGKKQQFETASISKANISDWIEEVETRALGAHPKSKLTSTEDDFDIEIEDALRSTKLDHTDVKGKGPAQPQGKRKLDNVSEIEQTAKKLKTSPPDEQPAKQSLVEPKTLKKEKKKKPRAEIPKVTEVSDDTTPETTELTGIDTEVYTILNEMNIDPNNPDTSSRVVCLPEKGEDRVLTATTNPHTGGVVLHDTPISYDYNLLDGSQAVEAAKPYLKPGRHGRHGDFDDDFERRTGAGHQVAPQDYQEHEDYLGFRGQVLIRYSAFPKAPDGEEIKPEIKVAWADNERAHAKFNNKYPGFAVTHLWPCGCEVIRDGGESEEE